MSERSPFSEAEDHSTEAPLDATPEQPARRFLPPPPPAPERRIEDDAAPQYNAEAERAVLGAMMAAPDKVIDAIADEINAFHFFVPAHATIFETIIGMRNRAEEIDMITIANTLTETGQAANVGSPGILAEITSELASHLNVGSHVRIVVEQWQRRKCLAIFSRGIKELAKSPAKSWEIAEWVDRELLPIMESGNKKKTRTWAESVEAVYLPLMEERPKDSRKVLPGIESSLTSLDKHTTGWRPGDMIVIGARPGKGKSIIGLQMAHHVAKARWSEEQQMIVTPGEPVGVFSMEMSDEQLIERMFARDAQIDLNYIRNRELTRIQKDEATTSRGRLRSLPIILDDTSTITIHQLRTRARRMKEKNGITLLIVDYLGLIKGENESAKGYNRQTDMMLFSRTMKGLARELKIPVIVLAQLNRDAAGFPELHHLRDSGAIEQDADTVLLLHEDEGKNFFIRVAKQRSGQTPDLQFRLNKARMTIHDLHFNELKEQAPHTPPPLSEPEPYYEDILG